MNFQNRLLEAKKAAIKQLRNALEQPHMAFRRGMRKFCESACIQLLPYRNVNVPYEMGSLFF